MSKQNKRSVARLKRVSGLVKGEEGGKMIDFSLTEEQELFRKAIARFAAEEIAPIADECDRRDEYPVHILKKLGELGYLGVKFPKKYGGGELGTLAQVLMFEELGRASAGITIGIYCHAVLALTPIALFGTELQKQKYLVPGIKVEKIGAFGMTEASAGSDLTAMQTKAQKAKLFATEACTRLCEQALQIHGAYGYMMDSPIQRFYRDTKVLEIGEGTSEIPRGVIAKQLGL